MTAAPRPVARATRLPGNPILRSFDARRVGMNVNGPSLIRTRDWMTGRLGRYHLYFAHHLGGFIRLAYADDLAGPWQVHAPGALDLDQMPWLYDHCASPDVHVDDDARRVRMYFHGVDDPEPWLEPRQSTYVALSGDGVQFEPRNNRLGESYFRVWAQGDVHFALSLAGRLWRAEDPLGPFERGPRLGNLPARTRHLAVLPKADHIRIAWSVVGDCPERIMTGALHPDGDWQSWAVQNVQELLRPEMVWEGAECPCIPSEVGIATTPVHQLRDPCFFSDEGCDYLLYSVAGESGIAIARFTTDQEDPHG